MRPAGGPTAVSVFAGLLWLRVGGSEKRGHYGATGAPASIAIQQEAFLSSQEMFFRTDRSRQGRAVVRRGEAHSWRVGPFCEAAAREKGAAKDCPRVAR